MNSIFVALCMLEESAGVLEYLFKSPRGIVFMCLLLIKWLGSGKGAFSSVEWVWRLVRVRQYRLLYSQSACRCCDLLWLVLCQSRSRCMRHLKYSNLSHGVLRGVAGVTARCLRSVALVRWACYAQGTSDTTVKCHKDHSQLVAASAQHWLACSWLVSTSAAA